MADEKIGYQPGGNELNINPTKPRGRDLNINPPPAVAPDSDPTISSPTSPFVEKNVNPPKAVAPDQDSQLKQMPNEAEKGKGQISVFDLIQRLMTKVKELKLKEPDKFHLLEKSLFFGKKEISKTPNLPAFKRPRMA